MWRQQAAAEPGPFMPLAFSLLRTACAVAMLVSAGCALFGSSALEFNPTKLSSCSGPLITVHVRWDFESDTTDQIRLYISSPGGTPKLWAIADPKGERDTGRWMHDGSTISVRNSKGKLLGIRTLETTSCGQSG